MKSFILILGLTALVIGASTDNTPTPHPTRYDVSADEDILVKKYSPIWLTGTSSNDDQFGKSIALLPDMNSDGINDLAVGAPTFTYETEDGGMYREVGVVAIFTMKRNGGWKGYSFLYGCDFGYDIFDRFGSSLAPLRDVNNDSHYDLALGAYNADGGGAVTILFRDTDTTVGYCSEEDVSNHTQITPDTLGITASYFGYSLASTYFFNETAFDLIVGGSTADGDVRFIKFNKAGGVHDTWALSATTLGYDGRGYHIGSAVAVLPDMDGNGALELIVGMQYADGGAGGILLLFMQQGYASVKSSKLVTRSSLSRWLTSDAGFGTSLALVSHNETTVVVAVGAPKDDYRSSSSTSFSESGSVALLYFAMDGSIVDDYRISDLRNIEDTQTVPLQPSAHANFGSALAGVNDLDGDGLSDLFVGSSGSGCCGAFVELFMEFDPAANYTFHSPSPTMQPTTYNFNDAASLGIALFVWLAVSMWAFCICTYALRRLRQRQLLLRMGRMSAAGNLVNNNTAGLTDTEIAALPEMPFGTHLLGGNHNDEIESCSICLEVFEKGHHVRTLPCGHLYHPDCIAVCLRTSPLCPLCRGNVRLPNQRSLTSSERGPTQQLLGSEIELSTLGASSTAVGGAAEDPSAVGGNDDVESTQASSIPPSSPQAAGGLESSGDASTHGIYSFFSEGRQFYSNCDTSDEEETTPDTNGLGELAASSSSSSAAAAAAAAVEHTQQQEQQHVSVSGASVVQGEI